ncbi:MAG: hypothetical protein ACLFWL_12290 [Candidatus Brocadiia bacterium]
MPESGDKRDVVIPAGLANQPLIEGKAAAGGSLFIKNGSALELARGAELTVYSGYLDSVDGPNLMANKKRPRGLVVEKTGRLKVGDGSKIVVNAGGFLVSGQLEGQPTLVMESVFHGLVLDAPAKTLDDLTLGSSQFPYRVSVPTDLKVSGNLTLEGGELHVGKQAVVSVKSDIRFSGDGRAAITPDGEVKVKGTIKNQAGSAYVRASDGWVTLIGKGNRRIAAGGVLPPLNLDVNGSVTFTSDLHSAGLLIGEKTVLKLKKGQKLVFGVPRPEWKTDPDDRCVIHTTRKRVPRRGSKDLHVKGRIEGVDRVPVKLFAQDGADLYAVSVLFEPKRGKNAAPGSAGVSVAPPGPAVSINQPDSPLKLKDGKLLLDGKPAPLGEKTKEDSELDGLLDGGMETDEKQSSLSGFEIEKVSVCPGPPEKLINIAPRSARISARPSVGSTIYDIADGDPKTSAAFRRGVTKNGVFRVDFSRPVEVSSLRFRQGKLWALRYLVYADTSGDGKFRTILGYAFDGASNSWRGVSFAPTRLDSIKLRALEGRTGWEQSAPTLRELEIYASPESAGLLAETKPCEPPSPGPPVVSLTEKKEMEWGQVVPESEIMNCVTVDLWMFGIRTTEAGLSDTPLAERERFQQTVRDIKDMGATGVLLFLEATNEAFWPSKNFESFTNDSYFEKRRAETRPKPGVEGEDAREELDTELQERKKEKAETKPILAPRTVKELPNQRDLLQEFVDALHEAGLKVYVICRRELFFPCYIGPGDQDAYMAFVREIAARGVDGISVTADEAYFGRSYPTSKGLPDDHPAREQFRERWGEDAELPGSIWGHDVNYKRWTVSSYEKLAGRLHSYSEEMKRINPDCESFCVIGSHPISGNNRMTYCLAYDVIGHIADLDYFGTDYQNKATRRYAAADPDRRACMEVWVPRSVLPGIQSVLLGARWVAYYRYNYIKMQKSRPYRVREFAFMRALEKCGVTSAESVRSIAVLVSRASEDWWDNNHGTCWLGWNPEAKRGFWTARAMTDFLNRNSYQYDVYYLDQPQDLERLGEYDLLFLPFPYSVKKQAVQKVKTAHKAGAKVLIAQNPGEVDEVGRPYEKAAFADLIASGKAEGSARYLDRDFIKWEHDRSFDRELSKVLDDMLGDKRALRVDTYGKRIEAYMFSHGKAEKSLVFLNWNRESGFADVELHLGNGPFRAFALSSENPDDCRRVSFKQDNVTGGDPVLFRVNVPAEEALLMRFVPAKR